MINIKSNVKSYIRIIFPGLAALLLFTHPIYSQNNGPSTYKIISISTEGNKFYDSRTIIANCGLKTGQEISVPSDDTRDAITRLWNLNLFSDIEIYIDRERERILNANNK